MIAEGCQNGFFNGDARTERSCTVSWGSDTDPDQEGLDRDRQDPPVLTPRTSRPPDYPAGSTIRSTIGSGARRHFGRQVVQQWYLSRARCGEPARPGKLPGRGRQRRCWLVPPQLRRYAAASAGRRRQPGQSQGGARLVGTGRGVCGDRSLADRAPADSRLPRCRQQVHGPASQERAQVPVCGPGDRPRGNRALSRLTAVPTASKLLSPPRGERVREPPLLRWKRVRRATYYNVQLYRKGRKVLTRWPRRASLQLRRRWRYGESPDTSRPDVTAGTCGPATAGGRRTNTDGCWEEPLHRRPDLG